MNLPIWVTVLVSGFIGGWIGRLISMLIVLPLLVSNSDAQSLVNHWQLVVILGGLGQAAITGALLVLLLPALSEVRVGFVTSYIATIAGNALVVIGTFALLRATIQSNLESHGAALPAFGISSLVLLVLGIAITATIIGSSAARTGGGRLDGYGGQAYLEHYRNQGR